MHGALANGCARLSSPRGVGLVSNTMRASGVGASGSVLARVSNITLVDVHLTVLAGEIRWAVACVSVDTVNTPPSILAEIANAVINVDLTTVTSETCKKGRRKCC